MESIVGEMDLNSKTCDIEIIRGGKKCESEFMCETPKGSTNMSGSQVQGHVGIEDLG